MNEPEKPKEEAANDTPLARLYPLLRLLTSGIATGAVVTLLSGSVLGLWHRVSPVETEKVWQVPNEDYKRVLGVLEQSNASLLSLEQIVATYPEASKLVGNLKTDIAEAQATLKQVPYVEKTADVGLSFSFFAPASAQETKTTAEREQDHTIVYSLLGLVAFVLVAFCLLYLFTQDKAKKTFAEKTITSVLGFVFGLLTGSMTGKLK
ncbi:hypothetical protein [Phyllobacterium zundukense]|uniref:Uncharacterized protein n=1 Tax=Phyllobacterium zundukense TaxID=1867719 RepID=A0A2N9VT45_9HYPH|nr:hypothetical protein [Phyllobacterium zundukense]ATU95422.1 hypothetical protein BLM14_27445 [Phyllobacterium zundukense]PIO42663.1 hypothetical protein B5P45_22120 [Phyllobacterium zundukense]